MITTTAKKISKVMIVLAASLLFGPLAGYAHADEVTGTLSAGVGSTGSLSGSVSGGVADSGGGGSVSGGGGGGSVALGGGGGGSTAGSPEYSGYSGYSGPAAYGTNTAPQTLTYGNSGVALASASTSAASASSTSTATSSAAASPNQNLTAAAVNSGISPAEKSALLIIGILAILGLGGYGLARATFLKV